MLERSGLLGLLLCVDGFKDLSDINAWSALHLRELRKLRHLQLWLLLLLLLLLEHAESAFEVPHGRLWHGLRGRSWGLRSHGFQEIRDIRHIVLRVLLRRRRFALDGRIMTLLSSLRGLDQSVNFEVISP